jgi:hypothetical protein
VVHFAFDPRTDAPREAVRAALLDFSERRPERWPGDVTGGATPEEIRAMTVVATVVNGRVAFCAVSVVCATSP